MKRLDGKTHDSELSDYLFDGVGTESLKDLGISGGIIGLSYKNDKMYLYIDYFVEKKPDDEQINTLWQEIQGQLADGAGPIFSGDCEDLTGLCPLTEFLSIEINMTED